MIHVGIVDDHEIVRAGFRELINRETDIIVSFEAPSGDDTIKQLREVRCNVLLLDLSLRGENGVDVLRSVRQRFPDTQVLVLSSYPEDRYAMAMIRNGASGYLCKDCDGSELLRAIRTVASGRRYLSEAGMQLMAGQMLGEVTQAPHDALSERELQVFLRLAAGESVSEVSNHLNLSVKTVSTYRSRVLEKLDISSNAEMAVYALRHGLMTDGAPH
ncbi:response regulator transcription factor [Uliginosibacterium sp. H1]|uniref:response regulator transcription factor n=1 Tax=Uliginosibacterium sp. H1 TaxID=3114757 RepID=UPI00280664AB|nr:response regulator transcription factor [Moraxellaceae bacterium]MEC5397978.1 response regulator transcription factor [Uliginosibacterium sp. H1]